MIDYNYLPAPRYFAALALTHLVHLLSLMGSGTIMYLVLRDKKRRNETYHRIVLAMSTTDFICMFINIFQPYGVPRSTGLPFAIGNQATCTILGFNVLVTVFISLHYNALLSIYFLLTIRYNKRDSVVKRLLEPYGHLIAIGLPLVTGLVALFCNIINPDLIFGSCVMAIYPVDCVLHPDSFQCERGSAVPYFAPIHFVMVTMAAIVGITCTWLVVSTVRQQTKRAARHVFRGSTQSVAQQKRVQAVAQQAVWYTVAFMNTLLVEFVAIGITVIYYDFKSVTNESLAKDNVLYGLFLYSYAGFALQGFYNWIIYVRPRFVPWRDAYPERGVWWAYRQVLKGGATPITTRTQHWLAVDSPSIEVICRGVQRNNPIDPTEESGFDETPQEFQVESAPAKRRGAFTIQNNLDLLILDEESSAVSPSEGGGDSKTAEDLEVGSGKMAPDIEEEKQRSPEHVVDEFAPNEGNNVSKPCTESAGFTRKDDQ